MIRTRTPATIFTVVPLAPRLASSSAVEPNLPAIGAPKSFACDGAVELVDRPAVERLGLGACPGRAGAARGRGRGRPGSAGTSEGSPSAGWPSPSGRAPSSPSGASPGRPCASPAAPSTLGCSACIARCDLICLTKSGNRMTRTVTTRKTIARIQSQLVPRTAPTGQPMASQTECQAAGSTRSRSRSSPDSTRQCSSHIGTVGGRPASGTGSYPPGWKGWQRSSRRIARPSSPERAVRA